MFHHKQETIAKMVNELSITTGRRMNLTVLDIAYIYIYLTYEMNKISWNKKKKFLNKIIMALMNSFSKCINK